MFHADPRGILALVAIAMCGFLAIVLYRVGKPGSVARKLALLLVIEGVTLGSSSSLEFLLISPSEAYRLYRPWFDVQFIIHTLGDCAMLALYPPFLAAALQTPMTRLFADKRVQFGLAIAATALFLLIQVSPLEIGGTLLYLALALVFWYALVASIHAWRVSSGAARTRARAFVLAFGIRDVCWGILYSKAVWDLWFGSYSMITDPTDPVYLVYALGTLLAVPLIAYGILRTHLFDIDLRIRWTIKQSTLAAAVVTIVYLISEGADRFLSSELGNLVGLLAAAVVVFFLSPLQRFAERVASTAMPRTHNTPEYAAFRKLQVYEAAVAEAMQGGGISQKERALLSRLRDSLGIVAADAEALERDLQARNEARGAE
jgi:tellurite resistance protein